jgi:DNA repair protein RecO (recombination protein O)
MRQPRSVGVEALVLRHADYGEADRLVTLFTGPMGKTRAIAKGARKITSRKAGHLEPFTHVRVQLARRREIPLVTQAETIEAFLPLREDVVLTAEASYVAELVDRLTYDDGSESGPIFRLLVETFSRLAGRGDSWVTTRYYEMRLLDHLGFRPKLFECAVCGRPIQAENQYFSYSGGGVVCPASAKDEHAVRSQQLALRPITMEALRYLRHFQRSTYDEAARARAPLEVRQETELLMHGLFTDLLERELKTPGFMKQIRR